MSIAKKRAAIREIQKITSMTDVADETEKIKPHKHIFTELSDGKKHHVAVFKIGPRKIPIHTSIACDHFNVVPQYGGVKNWEWSPPRECDDIDSIEIGLIVPRTCWDWYWVLFSERTKLSAFSLEVATYTGPDAEY